MFYYSPPVSCHSMLASHLIRQHSIQASTFIQAPKFRSSHLLSSLLRRPSSSDSDSSFLHLLGLCCNDSFLVRPCLTTVFEIESLYVLHIPLYFIKFITSKYTISLFIAFIVLPKVSCEQKFLCLFHCLFPRTEPAGAQKYLNINACACWSVKRVEHGDNLTF